MSEQLQKKRAKEYDVLRVILILLVVFGHSQYRSMAFESGGVSFITDPKTISLSWNNFFTTYRTIIMDVYNFHMPLFFYSFRRCMFPSKKQN